MTHENDKVPESNPTAPAATDARDNVLYQIDELIERVIRIRRVYLGVSFSAIILAPLSIMLSLYLILHPSFFKVLDSMDEFGYILAFFLGIVISISLTRLVIGLRQYQALQSWNKRYSEYLTEKARVKRLIAAQHGFDDEQ
jgi:hypothetical protein